MNKYYLGSIIGILLVVGIIFLNFGFGEADANGSGNSEKKMAIVIISSYDNHSAIHELGKGVAFYNYLIDEGYQEQDIVFLSDIPVPNSDGNANVSNVEDGFEFLILDGNENKSVTVYISDHGFQLIDGMAFNLSDGSIDSTSINYWLNEMFFSDLTMIVNGNRSGLAGPAFCGLDRLIICSMGEDEINHPDHFNITRSLENSEADRDNDGIVSFEEAFYAERHIMMQYPTQNPVMY